MRSLADAIADQPEPADSRTGFTVLPREKRWLVDLLDRLTPRQQEVLLECCSGGSSIEIAERMQISQSTLQNHLHAMRLRLGVTGRDAMARMVSVHIIRGYRLAAGMST